MKISKNIFIVLSGIAFFSLAFMNIKADGHGWHGGHRHGYYGPGFAPGFAPGFGYGYSGYYGYPAYYGPAYPYYGVPGPVVYTNNPGAAVALGVTGLIGTAIAASGR